MLGLIFVIGFIALCILFAKTRLKKQSLYGKVALVTGGSNGLGQQICIHLAKNGCNIAIADLSSAEKTLKLLELFQIKSKAYKVDVSDFQDIMKLRQNVMEDFGNVDILVNNAGLISYKTIFEQSSDEIERLSKVNVNSVILMTKAFLEKMMENGRGHILSISSLQGIYAFPFSLSYCSTKYAVTGFMLGLKEFLRRKNFKEINTTCIFPHVISTREDITSIVNPKISEIQSPEQCAKIIVDAIIYKRSYVTIPESYSIGVTWFNILPFFVQHFIRDFFRREHLFFQNGKTL